MQGATIPQVCKKLGVSEQPFYRWRTMYGALKEEAIRLVAEQALDISMLKGVAEGVSMGDGP